MGIKDWINKVGAAAGTGKKQATAEMSISDLVNLKRYDEALAKAEARVKRQPRDLHARLKKADVLLKMGRAADAVDEYVAVADAYAADGFFDKAAAVLAKVERLAPPSDKLRARIVRIERSKELEHRRDVVLGSLKASAAGKALGGSSFEIERLWTHLTRGPLIVSLTDEQLQRLFPRFELERLDEGELLARGGERRDELFVIVEGEVAARVPLASGGRTDLRAFSSGDIIGERALLKREPWAVDHVVSKRTTALKLGREGLEAAMVGDSDPRGFLEALRQQGHDDEVAAAAAKIKQG